MQQFLRSPHLRALIFRVIGHMALGIIALAVPEVGPNRFLLAAILIAITPPLAIFLYLRVSTTSRSWVEALFDLVLVVALVHLAPHLWVVTLCLGLMVALAPSLSLHQASHWLYLTFGAVLLLGMGLAAIVHEVPDWQLPLAAVLVTYPAMLYYTYTQMQRTNELRERALLMQGMTEVAGSVAHDFNNMLMGISGHAQLALTKLGPDHPARELVQEVLEGSERASLLGNQLQQFAGRNLTQKESVDVLEEVRLVARMLRSVISMPVHFHAPVEPLYVNVNISQLHQAVMNVLLNARDAMQGTPGAIEVRVIRIGPGVWRSGADTHVELLISDRGNGLVDADASRLFEPLYTTKAHGRGLGLMGVKRIMDATAGSVSITPRSGGGTDVYLRWPEAAPPAAAAVDHALHPVTPAAPVASEPLVLVVDDDEAVRAVARGMLALLGFASLEARDATEAQAIFQRRHQDITAVLLDLKMPGRDGWACLEDLREVCKETLVVLASGFNPVRELPEKAEADRHLTYLPKPFRADDLRLALQPVT